MLTEELRTKLVQTIKDDPREAIKLIKKEPKILDLLLNSENQLAQERQEKIKYINMTQQMNLQLQQEAKKLKKTQGILIGAGLLLLLSLLEKK